MKIGIDLVWVKVGKCGGTESYIRNLLNGFGQYDMQNEYVLFAADDNYDSFKEYGKYSNMTLKSYHAQSEAPMKRLIWENLYLDKAAKKEQVDLMFVPVYSKPITYGSKIPYVTCIADLQALHYPQYFSKLMYFVMKYLWWYTCKTSTRVITISEWCEKDIIEHYPAAKGRTDTLYIPIITVDSHMEFQILAERYQIKKGEYFYCVSSLFPHKNLDTILKTMAAYKKKGSREVLVLSGIGGQNEQFHKRCKELDIEDRVIVTGFVSNEERDCLYENCEMFLFPSIFEGFGMPPIEVMRKGKHVVMTRKTCLEEVTEGKAIYVENPMDVEEWMEKIEVARHEEAVVRKFEKYDLENIVKQYVELFSTVGKK